MTTKFENLIVIERSVLEDRIKYYEDFNSTHGELQSNVGRIDALKEILSQAKPITPLIESAFNAGVNSEASFHPLADEEKYVSLTDYLSKEVKL